MNARISIQVPLSPPLKDLNEKELTVLQLVINHRVLATVIDRSRLTDLETCEILTKLLQKQYLKSDA
jgi:hypothetical protein